MEVSLSHPLKQSSPIPLSPSGRVIEVKCPHSINACLDNPFTFSGIMMEVRPDQPKAPSPILVILFGRSIEVRFLQASKTQLSIVDRLLGNLMDENAQNMNAHFLIVVTVSGIVMEERLLQPSNADSPIVVIPSDKTILESWSHDLNASSPILVTL